MKRLPLVLMFLIGSLTYCYSQGSGPSNSDYKSFESKLEKSNKTIADPKKQSLAKTWIERANLFISIADVNTQFLRPQMPVTEIKLFFKEPKETKKENNTEQYVYDHFVLNIEDGKLKSWKETQPIMPNALDSAFSCFKKASELDKDGKQEKKIGEGLKTLKPLYQKNALNAYTLQDLKGSFDSFKQMVDIDDMKQVNQVDTVIIYYAGVTASDIGLKDEAIKLLLKAKSLHYKDPGLYVYLKNAYLSKGDSIDALNTLKEGFSTYPTNSAILVELINYYLLSGESKAALEYLAKAKENDPTNKSYLFAEGTLYDKMGNVNKAIESYQKAIELDSSYFDAYYNLAVVYFNYAVKKTEEANNELDNEKYKIKKDSADMEFKKAIPYMEKAHEINPKDRQPLETLKTLYYRLKMTDQLDRVKKLLDELPASTEAPVNPTTPSK